MVITSKRQRTQATILTALQRLGSALGGVSNYSSKELSLHASVGLQQAAAALQLLETKGLVERTPNVPTLWRLTPAGMTTEIR